jgi:heme exporter protein A
VRLILDEVAIGHAGEPIRGGLSMALDAGTAMVLTGPNGAGKTTLLRTIAGLLPALAGSIRIAGGDDEASVGQQAHLIGHFNALKPRLTIRENLEAWSDMLGGTPADIAAAITAFNLADLADLPVGLLSAGQRRRASLARLLTAQRPIWLLDEPTTALDTVNASLVSRVIAAATAGGGIVIAATHLDLGLGAVRAFDLGHPAQRGMA